MDKAILFYVYNNMHNQILDQIMIFFTTIGNKGLIWLVISGILLINKKTRIYGILTLCALALSTLSGEIVLKNLIGRPRPFITFPDVPLLIPKENSFSFPSGHTASSFAAAYVLAKSFKKYSPVFFTLAVLIGLSRIYLFMHYPSDVLAGAFLGTLCGWVVLKIYSKFKNTR